MLGARSIKVRGIVQGVGFRPFVFRLARANALAGWVLNGEEGVEIFIEGDERKLSAFVQALQAGGLPAAHVTEIEITGSHPTGCNEFVIRESLHRERPTVRISPDLPVCDDCLQELFDPAGKRYLYPYINCTNCGPRYTVILELPYDRPNTTMRPWVLDEYCSRQYHDPMNRRFHAQPIACPDCGPHYHLQSAHESIGGDENAIRKAADMLLGGKILAMKGLGGYHLACDARNESAVRALRDRKYRKEKPFALMARNLEVARSLICTSLDEEALLTSTARPIVIARAKMSLPGVAPDTQELGVMLPYAPLHHLLFAAGAPEVLVMTSANRSSEPIAIDDADALERLAAIADAFLIGDRPIARRVDDSIVRAGSLGTSVLRRARGFAPEAVTVLPSRQPILALGADLKNSITLVVNGQAFVSQHIGDLDHFQSLQTFQQTIDDSLSMYDVNRDELLVVRDSHPQYVSSAYAETLSFPKIGTVQHHRAHVASVLAERGEWDKRVLGVSFDGTGYGDDGTIWGGELFVGSVTAGFERVAHLRPAMLVGGDAAAHHPVQAAAGFLAQLSDLPDLSSTPFHFPKRYVAATELLAKGVRTFATTSIGRLFDAAAALLGFTRETTFEGQAAMWLEQLARSAPLAEAYPFPFRDGELDFRPLLATLTIDLVSGRGAFECARAFQRGVAEGLFNAATALCVSHGADTVVLSGGVFQNELLLEDLHSLLPCSKLQLWTNHAVPANDGGISLGQAALASFGQFVVRDSSPMTAEASR